jgi:hypothetical protein
MRPAIYPTCSRDSIIVITALSQIALDARITLSSLKVIPSPCSSTHSVTYISRSLTMFAAQYPPPSPTTSLLRVNATASHLRHESCYSLLDLNGDPWQVGEPESSFHPARHTTPVAVEPTVSLQPSSAKPRRNGHVKSHSTGNLLGFGCSKPTRAPVPSIQVEAPQAFSSSTLSIYFSNPTSFSVWVVCLIGDSSPRLLRRHTLPPLPSQSSLPVFYIPAFCWSRWVLLHSNL